MASTASGAPIRSGVSTGTSDLPSISRTGQALSRRFRPLGRSGWVTTPATRQDRDARSAESTGQASRPDPRKTTFMGHSPFGAGLSQENFPPIAREAAILASTDMRRRRSNSRACEAAAHALRPGLCSEGDWPEGNCFSSGAIPRPPVRAGSHADNREPA
jgi:hypothetical protein